MAPTLPPRVKMMHGPVAAADRQAVGGGNGGGDEILGGAHGGDEIKTLRKAGGDGGRQRAAGAMGMARLDAGGRKTRFTRLLDQKIDALGPRAMAALDQHRARAERQQPPRLLAHLALAARERS